MMKRPFGFMLAAFLLACVCVGCGGSSDTNPLSSDHTGDYTVESAGTYGPPAGEATVTGNLYVNASGVTLRNLVVTGNLVLGADIGNGDATLTDVTVEGSTIIQGGGSNSIHIRGTTSTGVMEINDQRSDPSGPINIVAEGTGSIGAISVTSASEVNITPVTDTIGFVAAVDDSTVTYGESASKDALLQKIVDKATYVMDNAIVGSDDTDYALNPDIDRYVSDIIDITDPNYLAYKVSCLKYYFNPLDGAAQSDFDALNLRLLGICATLMVADYREEPSTFTSAMFDTFFPDPGDHTVLADGFNLGINQQMLTMLKNVYQRVLVLGFNDAGNAVLNKMKDLQTISALYSVSAPDADHVVVVFKRRLSDAGKAAFAALTPSAGTFGASPQYAWDTVQLSGMSGDFTASRCTITLGAGAGGFSGATLTIPQGFTGFYDPHDSPASVGWMTSLPPVYDVIVTLP